MRESIGEAAWELGTKPEKVQALYFKNGSKDFQSWKGAH